MITKTASHEMIGNLQKYQQVSMTDGIASGKVQGGGAASDMAGMMMGMNMANEMMKNMNQNQNQNNSNQSQQPPVRRSHPPRRLHPLLKETKSPTSARTAAQRMRGELLSELWAEAELNQAQHE